MNLFLCCLASGVLIACLMAVAYHVGRLDGLRLGNRVTQETPDDVPTGIQCRTCLRSIDACKCPMAQRKGRA